MPILQFYEEDCMKHYQKVKKRLMFFIAPLLASSILSSPSQAATFASSRGEVEFINFSLVPVDNDASSNTNVITIAQEGLVLALADGDANFIVNPPTATNLSLSQALGLGRSYLGLAESEARVVGDFVVEAGTPFSFNFNAQLNLQTTIENPSFEIAGATGDIDFVLVNTDNNSILESFRLMGNIITPGDSDFITITKSPNVSLSNVTNQSNFGGNQESATATIFGSVQRSFTEQTKLSLVEVKRNQARVQVPEPSVSIALMLSLSGMSLVLKAKRKDTLVL
ncbi:PEP-CTERM sorting domain-containing protein [Iningainema tapete]|uniref:PEP-CTERM sorting domain-containing protein n=1 Tax=Iningainema tapete BLCC-T55 TaxID=2748662 RepID=A0A8J6XI27_9CYAN|nr:PEP-CTERM sorting domain-containing protein [Iningainema tapete]MBD2773635.1 PEP-CTERM sorting domain-containing protein [Iningainema tapete BLCC-T55]